MSLVLKLLLVIQAFVGCQKGLAAAVKMEMLSKSDPATRDIDIMCMVQSSYFEVKEVISFTIGLENRPPIAAISQKSMYPMDLVQRPNVVVHGAISKNSSNSFLRIIISNPVTTDAGTYVCRFYFMNPIHLVQGISKKTRVSITQDPFHLLRSLSEKVSGLATEIEINKNNSDARDDVIVHQVMDTQDDVQELNFNISKLETELAETKESFSALLKTNVTGLENLLNNVSTLISNVETRTEKKLALLGKKLAEQEKTFNDQIRIMQNELSEQEEKFREQVEKQNYSEAFLYAYSKEWRLKINDVMVYDRKLFKEGQGYDERNGIFTCQKGGFYFFHASIAVRKLSWINVAIQVNGITQSVLLAGDTKWLSHGTTSCVVKLVPGDKVRLTVSNAGGKMPKNAIYKSRNSVFAGYLLKAT